MISWGCLGFVKQYSSIKNSHNVLIEDKHSLCYKNAEMVFIPGDVDDGFYAFDNIAL